MLSFLGMSMSVSVLPSTWSDGILTFFLFTCGALALRRSSSCPFHHLLLLLLLLLLPLLSKFQNEFLKALKAKFNMESYGIWVKNFKSEDRFDLRGHSEAQIADFNFTLKNPDGFLIFCHRVSIAKNTKTMAKQEGNSLGDLRHSIKLG